MSEIEPARIWGEDDEPQQVVALFAVESYVGSAGWALECRLDERGAGTPLLWYSEAAADSWVRERAEEGGCGYQRVIGFGLSIRRDPPIRCVCCGEWGHDEPACTPGFLEDHTCVNVAREGAST